MRKLVVLSAIVVVGWWLISALGDSPYACGATGTTSTAADDCPSNTQAAAANREWAMARLETIIDKKIKRTTGLFYDNDGNELTFASGPDDDSKRATELLREAGVEFPDAGPFPATEHVETKIATRMRDNEITYGVVVINNERGPCVDGRFTCDVAVPAILPVGSTLAVWFPGAVESMKLNGAAK